MTKDEKELLIRVDERVENIEKWCTNHTEHHFKRELLAWTVTLGALVTLVIALLRG